MSALLWVAPLAPLAAAVAVVGRRHRLAGLLVPLAAIPALVLSLLPVPRAASFPAVLLGVELGLDQVGALFLFATALLWAIGSWYAVRYLAGDPRRRSFTLWWLLTMAGNLGLVVAADAVTFYASFALMTFSAYGLVVHERSAFSLRAGRIYIVMAIAGEIMLLAGLYLAVAAAGGWSLATIPAAIAGSGHVTAVSLLLLGGFGVKAGAVVLHMWLPLAHPAAPIPASAVLSGAMIKAGLLGWLRFLPLGETALEGVAALVAAAGLVAAFGAVAVGLVQTDLKVNLAYSSVSQMGIMTALVGIGLAVPDAGPVAATACAVYALHHGIAKGALFLGVGVVRDAGAGPGRLPALVAMTLPALALAGAPFTSGDGAKGLAKLVTGLAPEGWTGWLPTAVSLTSVATTVLMGRMLMLAARAGAGDGHRSHPGIALPWAAALAATVTALWLVPGARLAGVSPATGLASIWDGLWPILAGMAVLALLAGLAPRLVPVEGEPPVPPGDLVVPVERALSGAWSGLRGAAPTLPGRPSGLAPGSALAARLAGVERRLIRWSTAGTLLMFLVVVIAWSLAT